MWVGLVVEVECFYMSSNQPKPNKQKEKGNLIIHFSRKLRRGVLAEKVKNREKISSTYHVKGRSVEATPRKSSDSQTSLNATIPNPQGKFSSLGKTDVNVTTKIPA